MNKAQAFITELQLESEKTKVILERIPETQLLWKPHEKSMTIGRLGLHVAELPNWVVRVLATEAFDFGPGPYTPRIPQTHAEIMSEFEKTLQEAIHALSGATEEKLAENWKLHRGERTIIEVTRSSFIRRSINHMVHHRGQLSVYLRLLNVPVPAIYGPSADEK